MRALWLMVRTSLAAFLRNRAAVFWGVVFPLLLMGLIGLAFGRNTSFELTVSVVSEGATPLAAPLVAGLRQVPVFKLVEEPREEALDAMRRGDRTLVVVIPEQAAALRVYYDSTDPQGSRTALLILERFVAEANLRASGSPTLLRMETEGVAGQGATFFDFLLPGILALTVAQTGLLQVTSVIAGMRERLLLKRVMATPVSPAAFLGGLTARFTLVQLCQVAIIFLVATLVFGATVRGNLAHLAVMALVGAVTFFAIGFAISTVSRTAESANLLGSVVNFPMMFLSGTLWPRGFMPEAIRPIIAYLPLSPLVDAMRGISTAGAPLSQYTWAVGYLLLWAAGAFLLAARRFRWE